MSHGDLRQLDTTLNILATPVLFESITIKNSIVSAQGFWDLLHTHHIARHVQSITFTEGTFSTSNCVMWMVLMELCLYR
jgi:hypothetical protein